MTDQLTVDKPATNAGTAPEALEQELREAIDRIRRIYGSDLSALLRDVERELQKRSSNRAEVAA